MHQDGAQIDIVRAGIYPALDRRFPFDRARAARVAPHRDWEEIVGAGFTPPLGFGTEAIARCSSVCDIWVEQASRSIV